MTITSQLPLFQPAAPPPPVEKSGVVYTRPWAVELVLDLAGYLSEANLVDAVAVEPSVGEGSFLGHMAERFAASCRRQGRPWLDGASALIAYEIDPLAAETARNVAVDRLVACGVPHGDAVKLARTWVRVGDYLVDAPRLPKADYVIGNPPYVRLEEIGAEALSFYRNAYPTMRGRADLYIAFYEAALRQLAVGGVCAFLCADRWMSNQYGTELRRFIAQGYAVETVVGMHEADAFEDDVAAYPAVTVVRRSLQGTAIVATLNPNDPTTPGLGIASALRSLRDELPTTPVPGLRASRLDGWLEGADPWPCTSPERLALLRRLEAEFMPLESDATGTRVGIGVASGCDRVFITEDPGIVEPSRLLPLAMVADTLTGEVAWSGHYLVNPWDAKGLVSLSRFPRMAAYFESHASDLKRRHVAQRRSDSWYRTIDRVDMALTAQPKLYLPDMRAVIHPVLDRGETYPHHNLYFVTSTTWDMEVLGGLLLSAVGQFFVEVYGVRMRGGWLRFQAQYLRRIRVPRPTDLTPAQAQELRAAFRVRDVVRATAVARAIYRIDHEIPGG